MRELGTHNARRVGLDLRDKLGRGPTRVSLQEQVDVIGHNLEGVNRHVAQLSGFVDQFLEADLDSTDQDLPTILRTPDDVILEAENGPGVPRVSSPVVTYAALYNCGLLTQT